MVSAVSTSGIDNEPRSAVRVVDARFFSHRAFPRYKDQIVRPELMDSVTSLKKCERPDLSAFSREAQEFSEQVFSSSPCNTMNLCDIREPSDYSHGKLSTDTKFWLFLAPFLSLSLGGWFYLLWWFSTQASGLLPHFVKLLSYLA